MYLITAIFITFYILFFLNMYKRKHFDYHLHNIIFIYVFLWFIFVDKLKETKNFHEEPPIRKGDVAIVTGGSRGIGLHVVRKLVEYGYHVIIGVRDVEIGKSLEEKLNSENLSGTIDVMHLDLNSLKSVRNFADNVKSKYKEIDLIVNNAGIALEEYKYVTTEDGFEKHFGVNYLSHFLLTHLLIEPLRLAGLNNRRCSRVVNVSSCMHFIGFMDLGDLNMKHFYHNNLAYSRSKLAQIMFARYLNRKMLLNGDPVRFYSVHPGIIGSDMVLKNKRINSSTLFKKILRTPEEGAESIVYCCVSTNLENPGGNYINYCEEAYSSNYSRNLEKQQRLYKLSCSMLKIENFGVA